MNTFQDKGEVQLDPEIYESIRNGFKSVAISDEETLSTIKYTFEKYNYLLDPHGAVAVAAAKILHQKVDNDVPVVCLATAHPAKFPAITRKALGNQNELPQQAEHHTLESAKSLPEKKITCDLENLDFYLSQQIKESLNS